MGLLSPAGASAGVDQPNVLVVMSDDQPYGSTSKMPFLSSQPDFTSFTRAFNNNPLCCPARATFQSGLYSHHSLVESNEDGHLLDPSHSIATVFDDAGYETGLFGKYLNRYPWGRGPGYIPPGYDRWVAFKQPTNNGAYFDYRLTVDGDPQTYGGEPADYSTDVLAGFVDDFIAASDDPFFAVFTPYGSHAPYTPAPRHQGVYADEPIAAPPNFNRVGDEMHGFYRHLPRRDREHEAQMARDQYEALLSEDEALSRFFETLETQGELDETIVVFTTDNGYSLGSHRWHGKRCLFDECAHVELRIRAPGLSTGGENDALVSNVDLPTTLADLAGLEFGETDGESLRPLLANEATTLNRPVLLRAVRQIRTKKEPTPPSGWGIRTEEWKYIEYRNGQQELFDLNADPFELVDLSHRKRFRPTRRELRNQMLELRGGS